MLSSSVMTYAGDTISIVKNGTTISTTYTIPALGMYSITATNNSNNIVYVAGNVDPEFVIKNVYNKYPECLRKNFIEFKVGNKTYLIKEKET